MSNPIKAWRRARGKTQEDVALMLDVEPMTISRWERGESVPRPKTLRIIKRKMGIAPEVIIKHAMAGAVL
jgi:transcriptional regulator with XRE-family HTH domain